MNSNETSSTAQLTLKKVTTNPAAPEINNGVYSFKAEFVAQEASMDGAPLYVYHTGYKITVPEGYIGILSAADGLTSSSLSSATDIRIFTPGKEADLFLAFRLTTNASPAMFKTHTYATEATATEKAKPEEAGSVFANLMLIKQEEQIELTIIDSEDTKGGEDEPIEEATADHAAFETTIDKEGATDAVVIDEQTENADCVCKHRNDPNDEVEPQHENVAAEA